MEEDRHSVELPGARRPGESTRPLALSRASGLVYALGIEDGATSSSRSCGYRRTMAGKPWRRRTTIHSNGRDDSDASRMMPVCSLGTSSSLSAEASRTKAKARRMRPPGARERHLRTDPDAGDAADEQRRGERELEVAEEQVRERGRGDERHRLHQVGADELAGLEYRVEHHERDDDERAGPDRGHARRRGRRRAPMQDGPPTLTTHLGRCPAASGGRWPSRRCARCDEAHVGAHDEPGGGDAAGRRRARSGRSPRPARRGRSP